MEKDNIIAVVGGTGKAGKYLVKELLTRGYHMRLLVRNPQHLQVTDPLIEVVYGDVKDYETVNTLINGCKAVISTLGMGQPQSEPSIFSQATRNIIRAMEENRVKRYIVITGLNVDTPSDNKGAKAKLATDWMYKNYPLSTTDKQTEYTILTESDINWTLVRLPMIELTDAKAATDISIQDCRGDKISAADLADFLIAQLSEDSFIKMAPFIANA
jgi:putative NADH-flavin reductase